MGFHPMTDLQRARRDFAGGLQFDTSAQIGTVQNITTAAPVAPSGAWTWYTFMRFTSAITSGSGTYVILNNSHAAGTYLSMRMGITAASNGLGHLLSITLFTALNSSAQQSHVVSNVAYKLGDLILVTLTRKANGTVYTTLNGITSPAQTPNTITVYNSLRTVTVGGFAGTMTWPGRVMGEMDFVDGYEISIEEVRRMYNGKRGSNYRDRFLSAYSSLFRYHFDETSGATAYDSSGSAPSLPRHLSLASSPTFVTF